MVNKPEDLMGNGTDLYEANLGSRECPKDGNNDLFDFYSKLTSTVKMHFNP